MNYQYEVYLSPDKFKHVSQLRDLLASIEQIKYSAYGSFLSSMLFKRTFQNTFDLLVEDETQFYDLVEVLFISKMKTWALVHMHTAVCTKGPFSQREIAFQSFTPKLLFQKFCAIL